MKRIVWVLVIAAVLCAVFALCFMTDLSGSAAIPTEEVSWAAIPAVMVDGVLYITAGEPAPIVGDYALDGEITSVVSLSELPTQNDQSNFGKGYGYRYGAMEGTLEVMMGGERCLFATSEVRERIHFPRTPRIGLFFAANTSLQEKLVLTEGKPFWCITVENKGEEDINVEIGGTVYRVEAGTSATIGNDTMWEPGTYIVSFSTAGSSGMLGSATCEASAMYHETDGAFMEYDLRNGSLEIPAEKLSNYVFMTNSEKIGVTVKSDTSFEGTLILKNDTEGDEEILYFDVNDKENECLFENLTSALLYGVTHEGLEDCTFIIQETEFGWLS